MRTGRPLTLLGCLFALAVAGCAEGHEGPAGDDPVRPGGKADDAFASGPMVVTGAFDGSQRFAMWVDTLKFARTIKDTAGRQLSFTYFINTCFYDRTVRGSAIGTALSDREQIVRWALTQQAINEGHEIANHSVRHKDGSTWTEAQWKTEIDEFHAQTDTHLFKPIRDIAGKPVFPQWSAAAGSAAGTVGATCSSDGECGSGSCLALTPTQGFCTQRCNSRHVCPNQTVCGAPDWNEDTDVCVPMPQYPVVHNGVELFSASGAANLANADLVPYRVLGFRAPQLGQDQALYEVLSARGYLYDTSMVIAPGPPVRTVSNRKVYGGLYQFPLMKNPGSLAIPMDYNYLVNDGTGERMLADYKASVVASYKRGRQPWNIGHHFSLWKSGAYWSAMQDAFRFAAAGCPDAGGAKQCERVDFSNFAQLGNRLDGRGDGALWVDETIEDYQIDVPHEGEDGDDHAH